VFFRSKSVGAALAMLRSMVHFHWEHQYAAELMFLAVVSGAMMLVDYRLESRQEEYVFETSRLAMPIGAAVAMVVLIIAFAASETNAFIYFQF
jgi:hypothetical protein